MKEMIKRLFCRIGWHCSSSKYILIERDGYHGIADKYQCPWCGYVGMVDSHGNLFKSEDKE